MAAAGRLSVITRPSVLAPTIVSGRESPVRGDYRCRMTIILCALYIRSCATSTALQHRRLAPVVLGRLHLEVVTSIFPVCRIGLSRVNSIIWTPKTNVLGKIYLVQINV